MRIVIIDDEAAQGELLRWMVEHWGRGQREGVFVALYESAEAFLFHWAEDKNFDLLILDIQMAGLSGMELAKKLRADGCQVPIVFVTGIPDYMPEGYEVQALHYLLKPVKEEKLQQCLELALRRTDEPPPLLVTGPQGASRISQREIIYCEALSHTVVIRTLSENVMTSAGLGNIQSKLSPQDFIRCHRSYLVGLRHISSVKREDDGIWAYLDNGDRVPVARRLFKDVNVAFSNYYHHLPPLSMEE